MPTAKKQADAPGDGASGTDALYERAKRLSSDGKLREAIEVYLKLLDQEPDHLRARNNLGFLHDRLGDHEAALAEYEAAERLDPDDVRLQCNIAAVQASLGRYAEAEERLKDALHADPKNADAHENLGLVQFKKGLYQEAAVELQRAAELDPERATAYLYLGEALNRMDDVEGALTALQQSVELKQSPRAYYTMGILYDRKSQPDLANAMYRKAEELGGW